MPTRFRARRTTAQDSRAAKIIPLAVHGAHGGQPLARAIAVVEWAPEDRESAAEQQQALEALRCELGLTDAQVHGVHMTFIRGVDGSMWADGSLSEHEQYDLELVGEILQLRASPARRAVWAFA